MDAQGLSGMNEGTNNLGAGGLTNLAPGVYSFTSTTVLLNGLLQLNAGGNNNASWTFQIPFALTTASASSVQVINSGAGNLFTGSITWAVGSDAMLGTTTEFLGTIISNSAGDQLLTGATIGCGRVISLTGSVTLQSNVIQTPSSTGCPQMGGVVVPPAPVPEPATFWLFPSGLLAMIFLLRRVIPKS